jgi:cholesterol transport system auxiliary component
MRRAFLFGCAALLLAACVSTGTGEAERYFILDAPAGAKAAAIVRVAPTSAAAFYDTQDIVYSRAPGTRAYYLYNHWTERPQRAIHAQLAARLDAPNARLVLHTHLEEIYHDAAARPGTAHIILTARLVDPGGTVLARRTFSQAAPAASYDAAGAVQGFRQALGALLDELAVWAEAEAAKQR